MSDLRGSNLIFLISQPRAGSTMLQRILGSHSEIHTVSEPWIMLHPFYALRNNGYEAEYRADLAYLALQDFLSTIPGGEDNYFEGVRQMYTYLYNRGLEKNQKKFFLDKTPRYYSIIPELYRTFPEAHFIILLRNPLAVLCSIYNTWMKENRFRLYHCRLDLLHAPGLLLHGIATLGDKTTVIHYEYLLQEPQAELQKICSKIGISFEETMINYNQEPMLAWRFGDKKVDQYQQPDSQNIDRWETSLEDPQLWRLCSDYLQSLGADTIGSLGYSYEDLQTKIEQARPSYMPFRFVLSLNKALKRKPKPKPSSYNLLSLTAISYLFRRRGIRGSLIAILKRLFTLDFENRW